MHAVLSIIFWLLGIAGAVAFAFNLAPQLVAALRKKATGLTYGFFALALVGNIGSCSYVFWTNLQTGVWQWPLYGNYGVATGLTVSLLVLRRKYGK